MTVFGNNQGVHRVYSTEEQRDICVAYHMYGTSKAIQMTGVSRYALEEWRGQPWWNELSEQIQAKLDRELDADLTSIVHLAAAQTRDRLENGEVILKKEKDAETGEVVEVEKRIPMKGRDAAIIMGITYDKRQLGRDKPTSIRGSAGLSELAEKLAELGAAEKARTIEGEIVVDPALDGSL